jgi:hypothetical protein
MPWQEKCLPEQVQVEIMEVAIDGKLIDGVCGTAVVPIVQGR